MSDAVIDEVREKFTNIGVGHVLVHTWMENMAKHIIRTRPGIGGGCGCVANSAVGNHLIAYLTHGLRRIERFVGAAGRGASKLSIRRVTHEKKNDKKHAYYANAKNIPV